MALVLQDVRKAYRLIADYQQRMVELIDFIKNELNAEHYYHDLKHNYDSRSIHKIYHDQNVGKNFLPMLDMHLLWQRTKNIREGQEWQNALEPNDVVFDICLRSDESQDGKLTTLESSSELHIFVYQCVHYRRKNNWFRDIWWNSKYPNFGVVGEYKDKSSDNEYKIYGEKIDLVELFDKESTVNALSKFRKQASKKLGTIV